MEIFIVGYHVLLYFRGLENHRDVKESRDKVIEENMHVYAFLNKIRCMYKELIFKNKNVNKCRK